jgi:hypothetical protein
MLALGTNQFFILMFGVNQKIENSDSYFDYLLSTDLNDRKPVNRGAILR